LANLLLDLIHRPRRLFDTSTGPHPDVHVELSGINRREEILPEKWIQEGRNRSKAEY
jgi:hypothetical protein